jgi:hypothetical protein
MQLAQMVTRAYLQKQGDLTGVTMSNVNNLPAARQEIAERYDVCLLNDSNKARGEENSMKFKEYVALANVLVAHGQPAYLASILHIASSTSTLLRRQGRRFTSRLPLRKLTQKLHARSTTSKHRPQPLLRLPSRRPV